MILAHAAGAILRLRTDPLRGRATWTSARCASFLGMIESLEHDDRAARRSGGRRSIEVDRCEPVLSMMQTPSELATVAATTNVSLPKSRFRDRRPSRKPSSVSAVTLGRRGALRACVAGHLSRQRARAELAPITRRRGPVAPSSPIRDLVSLIRAVEVIEERRGLTSRSTAETSSRQA